MNGSINVKVINDGMDQEMPLLVGVSRQTKLSFTLAGGSCNIPVGKICSVFFFRLLIISLYS